MQEHKENIIKTRINMINPDLSPKTETTRRLAFNSSFTLRVVMPESRSSSKDLENFCKGPKVKF